MPAPSPAARLRVLRAARAAQRGGRSIYAHLRVTGSHRALSDPRVERRQWRPKILAWAGPSAFFRNRFYEVDRWYKARIDKPEQYPDCKIIDPDNFVHTLDERLKALRIANNTVAGLDAPVDIGFAHKMKRPAKEEVAAHKSLLPSLEKAARKRTLSLDVSAYEKDSNSTTWCSDSVVLAAKHYHIFEHCFHSSASFVPITHLHVSYDSDKYIVFGGNMLQPEHMQQKPKLKWPSAPNARWTLAMLNLDGNLYENDKAVLHCTDIAGNDLTTGATLVDYLPPLPFHGTGAHRIVFLLFAQHGDSADGAPMDKCVKMPNNVTLNVNATLAERSFDPCEFYKVNELNLTPATLAFAQCEWDMSVQRFIQQTLKMKHPIFEYDWPVEPQPAQDLFPEKSVPFNEYMDKHATTSEMEERLLRERLSRLSPFEEAPKAPMTNIHWKEDKHSMMFWQFAESRKRNMAIGRYKALYENQLRPSRPVNDTDVNVKKKNEEH